MGGLFLGHIGVGFWLKKYIKGVSLGWLFFAALFADLLWALLIIMGVEKAAIVPGTTVVSALVNVSFPLSHSFVSVIIFAAIVYIVAKRQLNDNQLNSRYSMLVFASAPVVHYLLDVVSHIPDLPLLPTPQDGPLIGLGLWNFFLASLIVENLIFIGGLYLYLRSSTSSSFVGKYGMVIYGAFMVFMGGSSYFSTFTLESLVVSSLLLNLFSVLAAFWLDSKREMV